MRAVADASVLIYLARLDALSLLRDLYEAVMVPAEVVREVVDQGKALNKPDAWAVERALAEGLLTLGRPPKTADALPPTLGAGEAACIKLGRVHDAEVLVDDREAHALARALGLVPRRTTSLLVEAAVRGLIDADRFEVLLAQLSREGYFMTADVFQMLVHAVREHARGGKKRKARRATGGSTARR